MFGAIIPALIGALLALSKLHVIHRSPNAVERFWQSLVKGDASESKHSRRLRSSCQVLTQEEEKVFPGKKCGRAVNEFCGRPDGRVVVETGFDMV